MTLNSISSLIGLGFLGLPGDLSEGEKAYRHGDFQTAQTTFKAAAETLSANNAGPLHLAAGASAYQIGDFAKALESYSLGLLSSDQKIRLEARFSMGNSLYHLGSTKSYAPKKQTWEAAITQFEAALKIDPNHQASAENLAFLKGQLAELVPPEPEKSETPSAQNPPPDQGDETNPPNETQNQVRPPDQPQPPENPPEAPETDSPEDPQNADQTDPAPPNESPEERARRILKAHAEPGTKPPDLRTPLARPEKDW